LVSGLFSQELSSRHAALHDVLTGLPNRVLFNDRLGHGLAQARRQGWTLAVMFLDLDDFKAINDTHGHDAGDAVVQAIAQRLKNNTRGEDTVSRNGGDESLYLLTGLRDAADIAKVAKKMVLSVQAPCDIRLRNSTVSARVKASIGSADEVTRLAQEEILSDRLNAYADEQRRLVDIAVHACSAIKTGRVGMGGATGSYAPAYSGRVAVPPRTKTARDSSARS